MIYKACLIAEEHGVYTKWEEFTVVSLLNLLFSLFFLAWLIHVKEITQALIIVE